MGYKKKLILSFLLSFILLVNVLVVESNASSPNQESLLLDELPYVITPSKVAQPVMESPSTITVLTKEDIRRYGNMSLSDILRNVPGVDVMSVSPTDSNVSMRGFNQLVAGRILTLINNRPIYVDFYGVTLWELLSFSIEEIERIEIIRGPGSALYGADAFDGIINIITNSNLASIGTKLIANVDQFGKLGGTIIQGGGIKNLTYNASLGRSEMSGWEKNKSNTGEIRRFNGELQYAIDDKSSLNLSGGTKYELGDLLIFSGFNPIEHKGTTSYIKMDYSRSNLKGLISWNRRDINAKSIKNKSSDQKVMDPNHATVPAGGDIMSCGGVKLFV